jgi:cytochrome d ubiquinol oxidase subunit II
LIVDVWFALLGLVIATYVVLDGFDLGAGALYFALGRTPRERERIGSAIGPVWNGNEVWVIVAGGVLFLAFPKAYAGAFSGLYFGLMIVLWLLIGRGLALELRHQLEHPLWHQACDVVFGLASATLAFVLGVALGNVVRGMPLGADGYFQLDLFGILNWYALLVGAFAVVVLCAQGASFLAVRTDGDLGARARVWARRLIPAEIAGLVVMIGPTYAVRHHMLTVFGDHPWVLVFPLLVLAALATAIVSQMRGEWGRAFAANSVAIAATLATMAAGLYPWVLPARQGRPYGLSVHNAAAGHHGLAVALVWFTLAIVLALGYFVYTYRLLFRSPPA